uniref:Uncharacterized protein n=1 Tax=Anopheles coluzzii TaxID=1518534 RepID=A0A8W7PAL5_ANOCL
MATKPTSDVSGSQRIGPTGTAYRFSVKYAPSVASAIASPIDDARSIGRRPDNVDAGTLLKQDQSEADQQCLTVSGVHEQVLQMMNCSSWCTIIRVTLSDVLPYLIQLALHLIGVTSSPQEHERFHCTLPMSTLHEVVGRFGHVQKQCTEQYRHCATDRLQGKVADKRSRTVHDQHAERCTDLDKAPKRTAVSIAGDFSDVERHRQQYVPVCHSDDCAGHNQQRYRANDHQH